MELADFGGGNSGLVDLLDDGLGLVGIDNEDHPDAHVEGAEHFGIWDVAQILDGLEDGERDPGSAVDFGLDVERQSPGEVIVKATACDVGDGFDCIG